MPRGECGTPKSRVVVDTAAVSFNVPVLWLFVVTPKRSLYSRTERGTLDVTSFFREPRYVLELARQNAQVYDVD